MAARPAAGPKRAATVSASASASLPSGLALAPAATRRYVRKALVHLGSSTPQQFSSFLGHRMMLPECFVRRAKLSVAQKQPVQMSFLGVGAPEALLVGIVALVVFGPKGLADAAKSIGAAVRSLQPSIKEVMQVSQELKGTLDQELGLDELREAARPMPAQRMEPAASKAVDPDIDAKRAEAAKMAWGGSTAAAGAESAASRKAAGAAAAKEDAEAPTQATGAASEAPAAAVGKELSSMSLVDLEAELARRKAAGRQ